MYESHTITHKANQLTRSRSQLTMHADLPPTPLDLPLGRPLQKPLHRSHTGRIRHLILGMILPQSPVELVPRGRAGHCRILVDTLPACPEFLLSSDTPLAVADGALEEPDLGCGGWGGARFRVCLEGIRDGVCEESVGF